MRPLYIFDLDGTLALIDHRRPLVEKPAGVVDFKPDWKAFFAACIYDAPNWPVIMTMNALVQFSDIRIFSGRSDAVKQETLDWLAEFIDPALFASLSSGGLRMREEGDFTQDDVLKMLLLDAMSPEDRVRLVAVFDDRNKVVKAWRDAGITCFQVAPGDF